MELSEIREKRRVAEQQILEILTVLEQETSLPAIDVLVSTTEWRQVGQIGSHRRVSGVRITLDHV